jgi:NAD(P)-dependent dehydrogenase (short-subunit alcohol dehydrogenase family)
MSKFQDAVVWITGGGSGLGRAMALEFARQGAHVAVSGRRQELLDEVVEDVTRMGRKGLAVICDCTDEAAVERAVATVVEHFGKLDVAVANAGFSVAGSVASLSADDWRRQLDINVVGAALTARHAIPHLEKTRGRLALVGSVAGLVYFPGFAAYQASKAAVLALGRTLAMELAPKGVSCTVLQPGFVSTDIAKVDNQGRFDPNRRDPRPANLMWEAEPAARKMVRAIAARRVEFTFTGHGRLGAWLGRHLPWLVQWLGPKVAPMPKDRSSGEGRTPQTEPV